MSIATNEATKYADESMFAGLPIVKAYEAGRLADITDREIEAAAQTRYEGFGPKERKWRDAQQETRCRELTMARSMLKAARKAAGE